MAWSTSQRNVGLSSKLKEGGRVPQCRAYLKARRAQALAIRAPAPSGQIRQVAQHAQRLPLREHVQGHTGPGSPQMPVDRHQGTGVCSGAVLPLCHADTQVAHFLLSRNYQLTALELLVESQAAGQGDQVRAGTSTAGSSPALSSPNNAPLQQHLRVATASPQRPARFQTDSTECATGSATDWHSQTARRQVTPTQRRAPSMALTNSNQWVIVCVLCPWCVQFSELDAYFSNTSTFPPEEVARHAQSNGEHSTVFACVNF